MTTYRLDTGVDLALVTCCACSVVFGIPAVMDRKLRETGRTFSCPNKHDLVFPVGKTEEQKHAETLELLKAAQEERDRLARQLKAATKRRSSKGGAR